MGILCRLPSFRKNHTHPTTGIPIFLSPVSCIDHLLNRTKLSKALITDAKKIEWRSPEVLKEKFGVTLRTSTEVASISPKDKTVTLASGETVGYDELVLSPGGVPRRIPIPGAAESELENVFTLRGIKDAKAISDG